MTGAEDSGQKKGQNGNGVLTAIETTERGIVRRVLLA